MFLKQYMKCMNAFIFSASIACWMNKLKNLILSLISQTKQGLKQRLLVFTCSGSVISGSGSEGQGELRQFGESVEDVRMCYGTECHCVSLATCYYQTM